MFQKRIGNKTEGAVHGDLVTGSTTFHGAGTTVASDVRDARDRRAVHPTRRERIERSSAATTYQAQRQPIEYNGDDSEQTYSSPNRS